MSAALWCWRPSPCGRPSLHALAHVSAAAWLSMLYMALFPSVLAYLIYYYALAHIPASRVSAFSYLQPVFATAMASRAAR